MSLSTYTDNALLDHLFGKSTFTAPTNIYVALSTTDPGITGSTISEPSGGAYARVQTAPSDWGVAASRETKNTSKVQFLQASGNWGTITHVALFDAPSGGNFLGSGALGSSKAVGTGDTASFAIGDLVIKLDP